MVLADAAKGHAVLPAFILGLVMAKHYQQHRQEQERLRVVAFAFLTPVLLPARRAQRLARRGVRQPRAPRASCSPPRWCPKLGLVLPLARRYVPRARHLHDAADEHRPDVRDDLLALRPERGDHRPTQFSLLVTVVVLSAIVPTAIAQRWFSPDVDLERLDDETEPIRRAAEPPPEPVPAGEQRMNAYKFENVLVAIDGSEGADRALDCAISLVGRLGGRLTALVVEGKLPAYAATAGEVDEVKKREGRVLRGGAGRRAD